MDYAKQQGDETIPRAWSRHTEGTSAFKITNKGKDQGKRETKQQQKENEKAIEDKKAKFRQFLKLMGGSETKGQSWNDNF